MTSDPKTLQVMVKIAACRLCIENPELYPSLAVAIGRLETAADQDVAFESEKKTPWFERYPLSRSENLA